MKRPIEAGCMARVISGMLGDKSPNRGLIVRVHQRIYECPQLGHIWRCEAEYGVQHDTTRKAPPGMLDFAQAWLERIDDLAPPDSVTTVQLEKAL